MISQTKSPGTCVDDATVGTVAWTNPDNAKVSDDVYSRIELGGAFRNSYDNEIKIVKSDGSVGTTNKADTLTLWDTTESYFSYGSSSDLWGETWTVENINDSDFGVVLSTRQTTFGSTYSHYLKATNFGFSIPSGATIEGILVEIEKKLEEEFQSVDHIRITVYYTLASPLPCFFQ